MHQAPVHRCPYDPLYRENVQLFGIILLLEPQDSPPPWGGVWVLEFRGQLLGSLMYSPEQNRGMLTESKQAYTFSQKAMSLALAGRVSQH